MQADRGIRRRPTSPELLGAARQVDQATQEMSNFGVASAMPNCFSGLI